METPARDERSARRYSDCGSLVRAGNVAKPSLFRLYNARRTRAVSRFFLVLLYQRAASAFSEFALSARLQHGSASLLLAVALCMAVSLERLLPSRCEAFIQAYRPSGSNQIAGTLLGRVRAVLSDVLHHAGILFDAVLPGARSAVRFRNGHGWAMGAARNTRTLRHQCIGGASCYLHSHLCSPRSRD